MFRIENHDWDLDKTTFLGKPESDGTLKALTPHEELTVVTCPKFDLAFGKAQDDRYEWKRCDGYWDAESCPLQVKVDSARGKCIVLDTCPNI